MKTIKRVSFLMAVSLFVMLFFTIISCNKDISSSKPEDSMLDLTELGKDSVFKLFLNDLLLYSRYVSNRQSENVLINQNSNCILVKQSKKIVYYPKR